MPWAKLDDGWWCHPKVLPLSAAARGVWASTLSWSCHQRKDLVPFHMLPLVGGTQAEADALVAAGLWIAEPDGYRIHDWAEYQERTVSEKRADAGRKGGKASGEARKKAADEANGKQNDVASEANDEAGTQPCPSQPNPTEETLRDEGPAPLTLVPEDMAPSAPGEEERFEAEVWQPYPSRDGKKLGKKNALAKWKALPEKDRRLVAVAVKHYADACARGTRARDCERFLTADWWRGWMTEATPDPSTSWTDGDRGWNEHGEDMEFRFGRWLILRDGDRIAAKKPPVRFAS